jgi:hypothetical protein
VSKARRSQPNKDSPTRTERSSLAQPALDGQWHSCARNAERVNRQISQGMRAQAGVEFPPDVHLRGGTCRRG